MFGLNLIRYSGPNGMLVTESNCLSTADFINFDLLSLFLIKYAFMKISSLDFNSPLISFKNSIFFST